MTCLYDSLILQIFRSKGRLPLLCPGPHRVDIQLIFNHNKSDFLMISKVNTPVGKLATYQSISQDKEVLPGEFPSTHRGCM